MKPIYRVSLYRGPLDKVNDAKHMLLYKGEDKLVAEKAMRLSKMFFKFLAPPTAIVLLVVDSDEKGDGRLREKILKCHKFEYGKGIY